MFPTAACATVATALKQTSILNFEFEDLIPTMYIYIYIYYLVETLEIEGGG